MAIETKFYWQHESSTGNASVCAFRLVVDRTDEVFDCIADGAWQRAGCSGDGKKASGTDHRTVA
jgi:hypothetical protein